MCAPKAPSAPKPPKPPKPLKAPPPPPATPGLPAWILTNPTGANIVRKTAAQKAAPRLASKGPASLLIPRS